MAPSRCKDEHDERVDPIAHHSVSEMDCAVAGAMLLEGVAKTKKSHKHTDNEFIGCVANHSNQRNQ